MKNEKEVIVNATTEIARAFQSYYSALYAVRQKGTQEDEQRRIQKIKDYLKEAKLPKIPAER